MKMKINIFSGKRKLSKDIKASSAWNVVESNAGPSRKMSKLSTWQESDIENLASDKIQIKNGTSIGKQEPNISISQQLMKPDVINNLAKSFAKNKSLEIENVQLINSPFQVGVVKNFLQNESIINDLVKEMENLEWTRKQMDLYEFYQTTDLANIKTPQLTKFYKFINKNVRDWMQQLTGMKFQRVSASCSMYNCGDFLLSHDDLLSDRLVAYVFYLTPWNGKSEWNEEMGGALELFGCDKDEQSIFPVVKKIYPSNNQLAFFKVEKKSHHQVGEVLTKDYPRLTINGWFHGFKDNSAYDMEAVKIKNPNVPIFRSPNEGKFNFEKTIRKFYLKDSTKHEIQKQIEEDSEAGLSEFFTEDFLAKIERDIKGANLKWKQKGPANQQNYEVLDTDALPIASEIKKFINLVTSKDFFKLLHEYTELDLYGDNASHPKCTIELQRWKGGCYTLIGDPSTYNNDTLDLILHIGNNENVGVTTYLVPEGQKIDDNDEEIENEENANEEEEEDENSVLLTIYPQNNFLNLVYRSKGTAKFTKYCYKSTRMSSDYNYILCCSYKE
jgi:phosphatidylinositol glycan class S